MGAFKREVIQLFFWRVTEGAFIIQRRTYFEKFYICVQYIIKHSVLEGPKYTFHLQHFVGAYLSSKEFEMSKSEISF